MTEDRVILSHVDKQLERLYDPMIEKMKEVRHDIYGNGKDGMKTRLAVVEKTLEGYMESSNKKFEDFERKIDKINSKMDSMLWKLATVMASVSILTQIILNYVIN